MTVLKYRLEYVYIYKKNILHMYIHIIITTTITKKHYKYQQLYPITIHIRTFTNTCINTKYTININRIYIDQYYNISIHQYALTLIKIHLYIKLILYVFIFFCIHVILSLTYIPITFISISESLLYTSSTITKLKGSDARD